MNFWETKEWIEAKTYKQLVTDKLLSRIEYLKLVGSGNYSEEKYRQYLKSCKMGQRNKLKTGNSIPVEKPDSKL